MSPVALDVLAYAVEVLEAEQRFPTVREIAERFGWSSPAAPGRHLRSLVAGGFLDRREGGRHRIRRLPTGVAAMCRLVPGDGGARTVNLMSALAPPPAVVSRGPMHRCATNPVRNPSDFRPRFVALHRSGSGTPAQRLAGELLHAHGDDALAHLPSGAPPGTRQILIGCGCAPKEGTDG